MARAHVLPSPRCKVDRDCRRRTWGARNLSGKSLFEDVTRVASGAASAVGNIRSRVEGEVRDHVERLIQRMNLVTREDYDVVAALAATARSEQEVLAERVAALEAKLGLESAAPKKAASPAGSKKPAAKPSTAATKPKASAGKPKTARPRRPGGEA